MPTLLDEVLVQGINNTLSHSLAQALSGGLSGAIGNLASSGMLSSLNFSPQLAAAVRGIQSQLPGTTPGAGTTPASTPAATPTPEASPVTVTANPANLGSAGGALGQVIAGGVGAAANPSGGHTPPSSQAPTDEGSPTPEVSPVTVTADAAGGGGLPPAAMLLPAGAAGAALLAGAGGGGGAPPAVPTPEVSPVTVSPSPTGGITPGDAGLVAAGLGAGAVLGGGLGGGGGDTATSGGDGVDTQPDGSGADAVAAGALPFGLTTKDLLAAGLLGGSLLTGGGGGGGSGDPSGALTKIADNNANLADRLGNIASAGMSGNIGGMGLNSIGRMVRKAQAAIRQRYASMGMSGSTAENQDLQAAADSGVDLQFKVGQEMATTGLNAIAALTGQSAQIYANLLNAQTAKDTALGNALANFAGSLVR